MFRITAGTPDEVAQALVSVVAAALLPPPETTKPPPPSGPDPAFIVPLCNQYFRLRRNAERLAGEGKESREVRALNGALKKIAELFEDHQIECRDLTGQTYDDGRIDFEPITTAPERVPGLTEDKILRCESPAILIRGKLAQKARGVVAIPA